MKFLSCQWLVGLLLVSTDEDDSVVVRLPSWGTGTDVIGSLVDGVIVVECVDSQHAVSWSTLLRHHQDLDSLQLKLCCALFVIRTKA